MPNILLATNNLTSTSAPVSHEDYLWTHSQKVLTNEFRQWTLKYITKHSDAISKIMLESIHALISLYERKAQIRRSLGRLENGRAWDLSLVSTRSRIITAISLFKDTALLNNTLIHNGQHVFHRAYDDKPKLSCDSRSAYLVKIKNPRNGVSIKLKADWLQCQAMASTKSQWVNNGKRVNLGTKNITKKGTPQQKFSCLACFAFAWHAQLRSTDLGASSWSCTSYWGGTSMKETTPPERKFQAK